MYKKLAPFLYALVSEPRATNSHIPNFKEKAVKVIAHGLSLGLCLALMVQCVALLQPVSAQGQRASKVAQNKKKKKSRKRKPAATAPSTEETVAKKKVNAPVAKAAEAPAAKKAKPVKVDGALRTTQDAEARATKKAEALAEKEAAALARKEAREQAKQEAAELAKKKAEDREKTESEDRANTRQMIVMPPYSLTGSANQVISAPVVATQDNAVPATKEIPASARPVQDLGVVNMAMLSNQKGMVPSSVQPVELKAIHPPQDIPEGARPGVGKLALAREAKKKKESPDSPIASVPSPLMTRTFKSDNLSLGFIPPDTMGAVGPNHAVTTTNEKILVHDRNGVLLSTVTLDAFWAVTPNGLATPSTFDPKILYDRFNDRFILVSTANARAESSATLFATSQTGNPLGTWNRYSIDADAAATSAGGNWADYPSLGFNKNWIVVSINRFGFGNKSGYQGPSIYVINKTTAYAGLPVVASVFEDSFTTGCLNLPTAAAQAAAIGCGFTYVPAITEDNLTNDEYVVEDWDSQSGQLRMTKVTGTQATPALTVGYQFPQSPYSWRFNSSLISGSGGYAPQRQQNVFLPSGTRPTTNDSRIQNAVLRNGSLWTTHGVGLARLQTPAGIAVGGTGNPDIRWGVQWWQINPLLTNTSAGTPPIQRAVIADPRADNCHNGAGGTRGGCTTATQVGDFYAFPTISVNAANDVLIGYTRFSPFTLAKAAYSFRAAGDPQNTMRDSMVFREGQGNYNIGAGSPFNVRWGDYSQTMVDPVNDNDFWTVQEYALDQREIFGPGGFAGLWSTWWGVINPATTAPYAFNNGLIISEFRMRGPAGVRDEFVELVNNTNNPITVSTTDGSEGWTLVYSSPSGTIAAMALIPNGTVIPAHGHYLMTNEVRATGIAPYSLSANPTGNPVRTADSDAMWTPDNADNGGFALFRTANQNNFIEAARIDAVGFAALPAGSIYREGAGLPNCSGAPGAGEQVSFVRKGTAGNPQDTGANENDFIYTSSTGASAQTCGVPVTNGAPTPLNRDSPPSP
jgi:hypothetical protein